jgi:hypothetical protein
MRLYRAKFYYDMERDWSGFDIESGRSIRQDLAKENEAYVKSMAPSRYWDALIPKTEIGCKRKVLDTDYLKTLWRDNVELVANDPVDRITETGIITRSVLAIGFATQQMLCPMEIVGRDGLSLDKYVRSRPISSQKFTLIRFAVGYYLKRSCTSLLRHCGASIPQLLYYDGSKHGYRSSKRHIHR